MLPDFDIAVRLELYREFVSSARAPSAARLAERLGVPVGEVRAALERLAEGKAIVLQPESREILIAAPLCAVPTPFLVRAGGLSYFGACIWDALGIAAMLARDADVETSCGCCGEAMALAVRSGQLESLEGVIHFSVPARRWWEDLVFT